jgi:hypothetical protein
MRALQTLLRRSLENPDKDFRFLNHALHLQGGSDVSKTEQRGDLLLV